jgi:hypothetical protein
MAYLSSGSNLDELSARIPGERGHTKLYDIIGISAKALDASN